MREREKSFQKTVQKSSARGLKGAMNTNSSSCFALVNITSGEMGKVLKKLCANMNFYQNTS